MWVLIVDLRGLCLLLPLPPEAGLVSIQLNKSLIHRSLSLSNFKSYSFINIILIINIVNYVVKIHIQVEINRSNLWMRNLICLILNNNPIQAQSFVKVKVTHAKSLSILRLFPASFPSGYILSHLQGH